ncbi:calcium:proton antiporter [Nocardioides nematodiphilus]|uniref:calcium:proton antiporter n=1 Tax=Nocardioides nematodiphilus TaxID=2849669 RepID=UPI001CDA4A40|nr:ionic transporter y4hA [Nocardioides nematodiphilus]MCA1982010.1 ionic transporter y4hA [Nocardioides nematodiphilus]
MLLRLQGLMTRLRWTITLPIIADIELFVTWGSHPSGFVVVFIAGLIVGAVLAAVHHAEVVAHQVGEPMGSLLLAVAVTVIEVGLIVALMVSGGSGTEALARDTVFAAVMICINGIAGLALLIGAIRNRMAVFNPEGTGAALAAVATVAVLCLVLPRFTTSHPGPIFTGPQLAFAALASLAVYVLFVLTQTGRYRDFFLPVALDGTSRDLDDDGHADPPGRRSAVISGVTLLVALVGVVGLAKVESGAIKDGVHALGLPDAVVGVIIALMVLLPESIAAVRQARADRVQISLNLAYGSAMASIGLTIPAIALTSHWIDGPLVLGLEPTQMVLLALTLVVSTLTVVPGRAKTLHGGIHLILLAAFLFLAASP